MGECIISRGSSKEESFPLSPNSATLLVTIKDSDGIPIRGLEINVKDGPTSYNYLSNSNGQALFFTNSGVANICINNNFNNTRYLDFNTTWMNVDAPIAQLTKANILISNDFTKNFKFTSNINFAFIKDRHCDVSLVGGGGGGGGAMTGAGAPSGVYGGGGGAGYLSQKNNELFNGGGEVYSLIIGSGGSGGYNVAFPGPGGSGGSGGTTYISNKFSASGGSGGGGGYQRWSSEGWSYGFTGGSGGLGSGISTGAFDGWSGTWSIVPAGNSTVNFAGGGGGGGWPYGGPNGGSGSLGGGGGYCGYGGSGVCIINILD